MPYPCLLHPEPLALQQSTADCYLHRRHSNTVLAQSLWGLWICLAETSPLSLDVGYLFLVGSNIFLSMVVQQCVVILEFSQEKMSTCPSTPPSWFWPKVKHVAKAMLWDMITEKFTGKKIIYFKSTKAIQMKRKLSNGSRERKLDQDGKISSHSWDST